MLLRAGLTAVGCAALVARRTTAGTGMDYCAWTTSGSGYKNC
jgi:hypothetical protein